MTENKVRFSRPMALFWLLRPGRTLMVASITGVAAFTSVAEVTYSLWMALAGWCLAVGGFSLDFYADRHLDSKGPRVKTRYNSLANPLVDGSLAPQVGLTLSLAFITASFIVTFKVSPWALIPWSIILANIIGLALHLFETPLARALTLGLLQALYLLMGSTIGSLSPGLCLLAGTLFFAMFGGRGMIDIRDFSQDEKTHVQTLPKHYGVKRTIQFAVICLHISYALSLAAYFTGEFRIIYLYLDLTLISIGLVCTWLFAARPSPRLAIILTPVYLGGQGILLCLAMIFGSM